MYICKECNCISKKSPTWTYYHNDMKEICDNCKKENTIIKTNKQILNLKNISLHTDNIYQYCINHSVLNFMKTLTLHERVIFELKNNPLCLTNYELLDGTKGKVFTKLSTLDDYERSLFKKGKIIFNRSTNYTEDKCWILINHDGTTLLNELYNDLDSKFNVFKDTENSVSNDIAEFDRWS